MLPVESPGATSCGAHQACVFGQKLSYRLLLPGSALVFLVGAVTATTLVIRAEHPENLTSVAVIAWLIVPFLIPPAYVVFASVLVKPDSITYRNFLGSKQVRYEDVTGLEINRTRPSIVLRFQSGEIYCGPTYERIGELIDILEASVRPYMTQPGPSEPDSPESESAVSLPRTFPRTKRYRLRLYLGIVFYVCPATVLSYYAFSSYSPRAVVSAAVFCVLSFFTLRNLLFSPLSLTLDQTGLACKRPLGMTRIHFDDVVEVSVSERRGKKSMRVRTRTESIVGDDNYENSTDFMRLVESLVPQDILESPISREFQYPRVMRGLSLMMFLFFAGAVVLVTVSGLTQDHADDFRSEVLFPGLCFGAFALGALYVILEYGEKVFVERDRIVSVGWRGRTTVSFDDSMTIERVRPWHGDECILVTDGRGSLQISHMLDGYDELIRLLDRIAPVRWRGEDAVTFPLEVRFPRWWIAPALYCSFGGLFAFFSVYWGVEGLQAGKGLPAELWLWVGGLATGMLMTGLGIRHLAVSPRGAAFDEHGFTVHLAFATRHYRPDQVQSIIYREERDGGHVRGRITILVAGHAYAFTDPGESVPLVPVYKLLCGAYWPEGYRDPMPQKMNRDKGAE